MSSGDEKAPAQKGEVEAVEIHDQGDLPNWVKRLPASAVRNVRKLCGATVGAGIHYFDNLAEVRRTNKARDILTEQAAKKIASNFGTDDPLAQRAFNREADRIIREQVNIEAVTQLALEDLSSSGPDEFDDSVVDDGWLHHLFDHAKNVSAEDIRITLAKVLAGEIRHPGTFSLQLLQIIATLSDKAVATFNDFAACAFHVPGALAPIGVRVSTMGGHAGSNALLPFRLGFDQLTMLQEHGLVTHDLNQHLPVPFVILTQAGFAIGSRTVVIDAERKDPAGAVKMQGPALTRAGTELFSIIDKNCNDDYASALIKWLGEQINQKA